MADRPSRPTPAGLPEAAPATSAEWDVLYTMGLAERRARGELRVLPAADEAAAPPGATALPEEPVPPLSRADALWLLPRGTPLLSGVAGERLNDTDLLLRTPCCCCLAPEITTGELLASSGGTEASSPGTGVVGRLPAPAFWPWPAPCCCVLLCAATEVSASPGAAPSVLPADSRGCRTSAASASDRACLLLLA